VRDVLLFPIHSPSIFSGIFIQAKNGGFIILAEIEDHKILIQDRRIAVAMHACKAQRLRRPNAFALEIIALNIHARAVLKRGVNVLAISHRCRRGRAVLPMHRFHLRRENDLLPEDLA
jgi:hypothetical protein